MSTSLWHEVADRVFQRRYQPWDVTVSAILGSDGLAVVDTRCNLAEAGELREHLRRLSPAPVRWVVNTHVHFDHVGGNAEFVAPRQIPPAELWGHRAMAAALSAEQDDPEGEGDPAVPVSTVVPDRLVDRAHVLDLGDRLVRLVHPGRGHTDGDLLIHIPDADALLAGDLVEESGPPALGSDSFPLDWPDTLDALLAAIGPATVVVPGHGAPVGAAFVREQRDALAALAARITALHAAGVSAEDALDTSGWPYPASKLAQAVTRGYAALDTGSAQLDR
ncbi:MBL fold metallo-hydrolase [Streptacidiphilus sp. EB103A]|uniref:MBL fold metallo-hydrolase n=1 Tax=Streptacidiphilus sp. EB103A TaxID=3156275 RepID=UPI0035178736